MLHTVYKTSRVGEEQGDGGGGGGGGLKNLPQFRLLQSRLDPSQEAAVCASPAPHCSHVPDYPTEYTVTYTSANFTLARPAPGHKTATVNPQLHSAWARCGRSDSLLPTRRGQVHPQADATGVLERPRGERVFLLPLSRNHFRRFFPLGYPPPWLVWDQTITFHRVLNNEKRWVFLFHCRRTHPSGWLCPAWPQRERPSRLRGPASLPILQSGRWGGMNPNWGSVDSSTVLKISIPSLNAPLCLCTYRDILKSNSINCPHSNTQQCEYENITHTHFNVTLMCHNLIPTWHQKHHKVAFNSVTPAELLQGSHLCRPDCLNSKTDTWINLHCGPVLPVC